MGSDSQLQASLQQKLDGLNGQQQQTPTIGALKDHDLGNQSAAVTHTEWHEAKDIQSQIAQTMLMLNGVTKIDAFQGAPQTNIIANNSQQYGFALGVAPNINGVPLAPTQQNTVQSPTLG